MTFEPSGFQIGALTLLALLLVRELAGLVRRRGRPVARLARLTGLVVAAGAIAFPQLVTQVARQVGVGRGSDLVFYLFMFVATGVAFSLYARCVRLERRLTAIVRWQALHSAECGVGRPNAATDERATPESPQREPQEHVDGSR